MPNVMQGKWCLCGVDCPSQGVCGSFGSCSRWLETLSFLSLLPAAPNFCLSPSPKILPIHGLPNSSYATRVKNNCWALVMCNNQLAGYTCPNSFAESETPHLYWIPSGICLAPWKNTKLDAWTLAGHWHLHPCPCNAGYNSAVKYMTIMCTFIHTEW